ncbi:hypothetical protein K3165_02945 [Qipengyuania sp. 1XM1-15A]|uniref:hypothetical protein n=1 Tax=Qipengyuania xiamenensis TaxID=2867237 RepID=UPI001C877668|nr:hypothetical protein [Qipengyuania xiamenensis]MBX7531880.1 hypothetical protein [Qipengyuania xiamenensis]
MLDSFKLSRLENDWYVLQSDGHIEVIERVDGRDDAVVTFAVEADSLGFFHRDNRVSLRWCKSRNCADAAIVVSHDDRPTLHVVELKSKLTNKEWVKTKKQFEGMALNYMAMAGVVEGVVPDRAVFHVSFESEVVAEPETSDPVLLKMSVGSGQVLGGIDDWINEKIDILSWQGAELRKIPRGEDNRGQGDLSV